MVKRYKLFVDSMADCYCEIDHHHDGSYVHLDDYAKLERKLAEARELLTWCATHWCSHVYEGSPSVHFLSRIDAFMKEQK